MATSDNSPFSKNYKSPIDWQKLQKNKNASKGGSVRSSNMSKEEKVPMHLWGTDTKHKSKEKS